MTGVQTCAHPIWEASEMPAENVSRRTAGEGSGRTARVYVSEESHSGVVPMNHSNKDRTSLAESEEGRPLIKENTSSIWHVPDTERVCACPTGGRVCGQAVRLAAIHPR